MVGSKGREKKSTCLLAGLQEIYKKKIFPVESSFRYDAFFTPLLSDNEIQAKPMVLLLGQYSTGKTTFIQSLLGREYPGGRIGPEPTTDRFVAVMHGQQDRVIPGNAATLQSDKALGGLTRFGSSFLAKFQVSEVCCQLLESVSIVDTPGVLSGDKQRLGRAYDFPQVCEWFAEHSDLILVFFDAHKLDISDELKEVLKVLEPHDDKIRIVLNKADQVGRQELLRVYGALMWSLGKVVTTPEVPRVFISSFHPENVASDNRSILLEEERMDLVKELRQLPMNSTTRKVNDLIKRARLARVHAIIISHLRSQLPSWYGKEAKQTRLLENLADEFTKVQQLHQIPTGDFPDIEEYCHKLKIHDLNSYPKLSTKYMNAIEEAVHHDIPELMRLYPPVFSELKSPLNTNPFDDSSMTLSCPTEELWKYDRINKEHFRKLFENQFPVNGKLDGPSCRTFFMQSGLPEDEMAMSWAMCDLDKDGMLTFEEFAIMLYIVQLRLKGIEIPKSLPVGMHPTRHDTE